ncbi:MAG: radical SAM protein [Candidatus Thermoplasmatota archaeon]
MNHRFIKVDNIITPIIKKDKLFHGDYTVDPYQYCEFNCSYCDSSSKNGIIIKSNAIDALKKEINQIEKGVIIVGSVHDPYQPLEERYRITRGLLEVISDHNYPCHILTKSSLVLRDIDIISRMNKCYVTISISTIRDKIARLMEPYAPSPIERLKTIKKLTDNNITSGLAIIPLLPYTTEEEIEDIIRSATIHHAQYLLYKHLMLTGDQREHFLGLIDEKLPDHADRYKELYRDRISPSKKYLYNVEKKIRTLSKRYKIPNNIPLT